MSSVEFAVSNSTIGTRHSTLNDMTSTRSALLLAVFGLLAAGLFWATDPTLGIAHHLMDPGINYIDAANQAWPGTVAGLLGSAVMVVTGLWLALKRTA